MRESVVERIPIPIHERVVYSPHQKIIYYVKFPLETPVVGNHWNGLIADDEAQHLQASCGGFLF